MLSSDELVSRATTDAAGRLEVTPTDVMQARGRVRIVDVREPDEFVGELGHVPEAELVPLATVESAAEAWPRESPLVVVCRSGARSGRAVAALSALGFTKAMNMTGGMIAWSGANLPVVRT